MIKPGITLQAAGIRASSNKPMVKIDKTAIKAHKRIVHLNRCTEFLCVPERDGVNGPTHSYFGSLKEVGSTLVEHTRNGYGVFMLINKSNSKGRKASDIVRVNALFIDVDKGLWHGKTIEDILKLIQIEPHLIVNTSPGNFHVFWLVDDVDLNDFSTYQKRLSKKFGADSAICDLPRVMRLAGTINHKRDVPFLAQIVYQSKGLPPYKIKEFVAAMFGNQCKPSQEPIQVASNLSLTSQFGDELHALRDALFSIPADDRGDWSKIGMALKTTYADEGYSLFIEWSRTSPKFDAVDAKRQWDSFKHQGGITVGTIYYLAKQRGHQPMSGKEMNTTFDLAKAFVSETCQILQYDPTEKKWFTFTKGQWQLADVCSEKVAHDYLQKMAQPPISNTCAFRLTNTAGIRELLKLAAVHPQCHIQREKFDANPNVIGVIYNDQNSQETVGVIDLLTGKVRAARPEDRITKTLSVAYDSYAECPRFLQFINEITNGDKQLATTLQLIFGYTLFGHTKAQLMFVLIGEGENGKGVLMRLMGCIFGPYWTEASNSLIRRHNSNPNAASPAVAALAGIRLITCAEFPKNTQMEESFVKSLTGSDPITYRGNYESQKTFIPQGKLFLHTNDFPNIGFDDHAMWRRLHVIPFCRQFSAENRDNNLEEKLRAELSGILNWIIEGAVRYAKEGTIPLPESSVAYMAKLKLKTDTVGAWLIDCCDINDGNTTPSSAAYTSYKEHAKNNNMKQVGASEFKKILKTKGYGTKHTKTANVFIGFRIKLLA